VSVPNSPFVGLAAFTPHMAAYFTGRERFALTLAGAALRSRVTVMYGQSGCGKSSVLGAAFPQAIRATLHDDDETTPGPPFRLLHFRRWHPGFETRLFHAAAAKLETRKDSGLAAAVAGWSRDREQKPPVILVLDQFEEFLLYHPKPSETSFVQNLATIVADPNIEARVLLSLREDALASLDALRAVIPGILSSPVQLRPLDRAAAEQAIRRPVAKWSEDRFGDPKAVAVEQSLVDTLLDQVRQTGTAGLSAQSSPNGPANLVELPLLQLTLERLWEEEAKAEKPVLRAETLKDLGDAAGIARRHLDQTLGALPAPQRALAIRLFRHLVTATGGKHAWRADDLTDEIDADRLAARQAAARTILGRLTGRLNRMATPISAATRALLGTKRTSIAAEATKAVVSETLDKLAQGKARILRTQPDPRGQGPLFELYHDALARPVLSWVQEARVNEAVRRQHLRAAIAVSVALLMMALSVTFYILYSRAVVAQQEALRQKDHAVLSEQQTKLQEARAVATLARQETESGDAMTGMLSALAVLPKDPAKPDRPVSNAAAAALLSAWIYNRERYDLIGYTQSVSQVAITPDGRHVVTGSEDHTVRIWDLSGAIPVVTRLEGHNGDVASLAISEDGRRVVTASPEDNTARVWDLSGTTPVLTLLEGHSGSVTSVAITANGRRVVTGSKDNTARLWDLSGAIPAAKVLEKNQFSVTSVAITPDGRSVVTGSSVGTARVWDLSGATPSDTELKGHRSPISRVAITPDGRRAVTAALVDAPRVWDLSSATPVSTPLEVHGYTRTVAITADGQRVVTGSSDYTARVWDLSGTTPIATPLEGHLGWVTSVAITPDGRRVVTGSFDRTARVWDLSRTNPVVVHLKDVGSSVTAMTPDGRWAVTSVGRPTLTDIWPQVWDLSAANPVAVPLEGAGAQAMAITPDGRHVVTASPAGSLRVWDLSAPSPVFTLLEGQTGSASSGAITPDGRWVVIGSYDKTARVWDLSAATGVAVTLGGHRGAVKSVAITPDGRRVVTGSADYTARVWDLSGGTSTFIALEGHTGSINSVAITPDGHRVVTGASDDDNTARVWDLSGPTPLFTPLEGHRPFLQSVAITSDGSRVVTGSWDGTARLWDMSGDTPAVTVLQNPSGKVVSVGISPNGQRLMTGSDDATARVWETPAVEVLIPLARTALTRCLTIAQRDAFGLPVLPRAGKDRDRIDPPPCQ
jgi:WD40 repeat protein